MRAGVLLLLLALFATWPVVQYRSWVGTEGRRVEIAREMAASGDLVVPTLGLEPTVAKPPFYYWVLAAVERGFGHGFVAMRLPSVLSLWLIAWLAFTVLRRSHDAGVGWIAGLGILCSPVVLWHGGLAEIDPMFAAFSAGSVLLLGHAAGFERFGIAAVAGILGAAALLSKGPPFFLCLLGPLLVSWRRGRLKAWLPFVVPLMLPPVIYYAVLESHPVGSTLGQVAQAETLDRLWTYRWHHVADLPAYFGRVLVSLAPFVLFTFAEYRGAHDARLQQGAIQQRFCTSAALGAVLLIALFPGRATRYLLPAVLLFCIGIAPRVAGYLRYPARIGPMPKLALRVLAVVGALGLCVLPWTPFPTPGRTFWFAGILASLALWFATRERLHLFVFAIPVVAVWTVFADRATRTDYGVRSTEDVAAVLHREFDRRDVDLSDLATFGHFNYAHLFWADTFVPGDEFGRRPPTTAWLLVEQSPGSNLRPEGYVDVLRVRSRNRSVVLQRREPAGG